MKDRITLLEEQIKTCTEDFKSEERDKLELKRRCNDQDLKIDIYERQVLIDWKLRHCSVQLLLNNSYIVLMKLK